MRLQDHLGARSQPADSLGELMIARTEVRVVLDGSIKSIDRRSLGDISSTFFKELGFDKAFKGNISAAAGERQINEDNVDA